MPTMIERWRCFPLGSHVIAVVLCYFSGEMPQKVKGEKTKMVYRAGIHARLMTYCHKLAKSLPD